MAHRIRAEREEEFARKRAALNPQKVPAVTSELAAAIAQEVYAMVMRQDDTARESSSVHAALLELAALVPGPGAGLLLSKQHDSDSSGSMGHLDGLPERAVDVLASLNEHAEADAAIMLVRRNLAAVRPLADDAARGLGLAIDWAGEGARDALREALGAYRRARADCTRRDSGVLIVTPSAESLGARTAVPNLSFANYGLPILSKRLKG